jgi:2,4-dienoyl-CoA reductase-like NADH-dependent reductase (Old Yellow Enzyme family)/thioredoxin reductase
MQIFEPIELKEVRLKNRLVMASMGTNLADSDGFVTKEMEAYYGERAKGGVGLIMTELVAVDFLRGSGIEHQLSIDDDKYIPGLRKLVDQIHQYGAKVFVQLNHAGSRAKSHMVRSGSAGSSNKGFEFGATVSPNSMTPKEIDHLIELFGRAARRSKEAGFDGIDVHFSHGYLLSQFLSNLTNGRADEYGGSLENRARLPLQVLERCRHEIGSSIPITGKITGKQYLNRGITLKEAKVFAHLLEERGIDAIQVSGGDPESSKYFPVPTMFSRRGCYVRLAQSIKKDVAIPVIAVGRINTIQLANKIIEAKKADLVAMGRAFLADPYFPQKGMEGKYKAIRICIGCNQGCRGRDRTRYLAVGCVLNPQVGKERNEAEFVPTQIPKKLLVVGGGPGGMEVARGAALKGHSVTLVEEKKVLGGQLLQAQEPPGRREFRELISWYRFQLSKVGVRVIKGRKVTPDFILDSKPDILVLATGSRPLFSEFKRPMLKDLVYASEILENKVQTGQKVLIIGGGGVGLETADYLSSLGKRVTIIEMLPEVGRDVEGSTKKVLMERLAIHKVNIFTHANIYKSEGGKVFVKSNGCKKEIVFTGPIVNAAGAKANNDLCNLLKKSKRFKTMEIYEIGDCVAPRMLRDAIFEGYAVAQRI